jgi:hypothetical protein
MTGLTFWLVFSRGDHSSIQYGYGDPVIDVTQRGAAVLTAIYGGTAGFNSMAAIYPVDGIIETYSVSQHRGQYRLMMTATRDAVISGQASGRVTAMTAICEIY